MRNPSTPTPTFPPSNHPHPTTVPPYIPGEYGLSGTSNNPIQASIWTIDLSCGFLTSTLINPDKSSLTTAHMLDSAECPDGCLYQTRSEEAYVADHPHSGAVRVVRLKFLPLL
ncbi:hypothetical protein J1614_011991 [Plenodomus biglobosus]|nr:hypothetical protein J1614_011991 [Plenodomus biglobosus]